MGLCVARTPSSNRLGGGAAAHRPGSHSSKSITSYTCCVVLFAELALACALTLDTGRAFCYVADFAVSIVAALATVSLSDGLNALAMPIIISSCDGGVAFLAAFAFVSGGGAELSLCLSSGGGGFVGTAFLTMAFGAGGGLAGLACIGGPCPAGCLKTGGLATGVNTCCVW